MANEPNKMQGLARIMKKKEPNLGPMPPTAAIQEMNIKDVSSAPAPSPTPKKKSKEVDKYKLGEQLGKGAYSTVYKGLNVATGNFVAVKRIKRKKIAEDALKIEISLLKSLSHENIVRYIDLIVSDSHINLVLEYIESGSLAQVIEKFGVFPEPLVAMYVEQVLNGLAYLHDNGIVHRDIKGPNLLITKEGVVKLADFGIAVTSTIEDNASKFHATVVEGSPFWMAPELIQMSTVTTASDIWSIGCTIIELITGYPPYFDNSGIAALYRMVNDPHPPLPEEISADLLDFLKACFQKEPTKRPTAKDLLNMSWIVKIKAEKKSDWRKTLRQVQKYNTAKREQTLRTIKSIADMDWNQIQQANNAPTPTNVTNTTTPANAAKPTNASTNNSTLKNAAVGGSIVYSSPNNRQSSPSNAKSPDPKWSPLSPPGTPQGSFLVSPKDPLLIGHRTTPIGSGTSPNSTIALTASKVDILEREQKSSDVQFVVIIAGIEARKNFLFSYNVYKIKVAVTYPKELANAWVVFRSFSEISDIDSKIRHSLSKTPNVPYLPDLPKVKFFGNGDQEYTNYIAHRVGEYFKKMIEVSATHKLLLPFLSYDSTPDTNNH